MSIMHDEDNDNDEDNDIENARIGYEKAIDLWIYEGETYWSKFNAFVVAHSIIIGAIVLSITQSNNAYFFPFAFSIIGMFLCYFWFRLLRRSFGYYDYWIFSAREIEEKNLADLVKTVSRGGKFAEGEKVNFELPKTLGNKPLQLDLWGRDPVMKIVEAIIWIFMVAYLITLIIISIRMTGIL
jgi:hypothetical protein